MKKKYEYEVSSGNVFKDLGLSNPEERLAKADLAIQINILIEQKKLTQSAAARLLDIDQPKISALTKSKLSGFSLERLFRFLTILGQDVTIKVSPKKISKVKAQVIVTLSKIKKDIPTKRPVATDTVRVQARKKK